MEAVPAATDDAQRARVLHELGLLDGAPEPGYDGLAACAALICGCPFAAVTLFDGRHERLKAAHGFNFRELPRQAALGVEALLEGRAIVVADLQADARFAGHPLVAGPPQLRFYAAEPLRLDGLAVGTLCVADRAPRALDPTQADALHRLAEAANELLRGRQRLHELDLERRRVHEREALLAKLAAQLPGALHQYRVDADGRETLPYSSAGLHEFLATDGVRLAGSAQPMFDRVLPDDLPGLRASIEQSRRALTPWRREFRLRRADGAVRWVLGSAMPEREPDGGTIWHGFTIDVTALKETELALRRTEARWSMASSAAGIGVAEVDLAEGVMQLDAQACRNHGIAFPHARMTLDDWFDRVVPEDRAGAISALQRALDTGGTMEGRYRLRWPDSSVHTLEVVARAVEAEGVQRTLIGTCRDVTEQQQADQLRRDKEAAERANRAKSEFLSRVSHELRTPLNGILGFMQLIAMDRRHPLADDQRRRLEGAQRSARHLLALVNDVLDLTRVERDDFRLVLGSVDLRRAADAALVALQPLAQAHGIALPPPTPPCWVHANARALEQVLMNLLSNAIKYNRRGGAVQLALDCTDHRVRVAVIDEGPGLSAEQQRQLFQPFNRLGAERTRVDGNGLGLVIARRLVDAMHGQLRIDSRPGAGSRFTVELGAALPVDAASAPMPLETAPAPLPGAPRRVLYIEDEPLNVLLLEEVFRHQPDWSLDVAPDGAQGLARARAGGHDLVLVDMNLPDMSGIDVVRALRADPATASLRCIALSADAMREQVAAARNAGFDDYWTKPIDVRRIVAALERALAG